MIIRDNWLSSCICPPSPLVRERPFVALERFTWPTIARGPSSWQKQRSDITLLPPATHTEVAILLRLPRSTISVIRSEGNNQINETIDQWTRALGFSRKTLGPILVFILAWPTSIHNDFRPSFQGACAVWLKMRAFVADILSFRFRPPNNAGRMARRCCGCWGVHRFCALLRVLPMNGIYQRVSNTVLDTVILPLTHSNSLLSRWTVK